MTTTLTAPTTAPAPPSALSALLEYPSFLDDVTRELHRRSFYAFFVYMWPVLEPSAPYLPAQHTRAICEHLQAVFEGRIPLLSIEIGPGYGKSFISAVAFPAWIWACRDAGYRMGFSTYADDLTTRDSTRCRDLILSERYQALYGHVFKLIKLREDYLRNDKGGYRVSLAVGGKATGYRFNLWIGDDLLNMSDARSDTKREPFKTHLRAISSRGQIGKPYYRVIIGQRLHEDDPGNYAREKGYQVLCLPTEYDPSRHCETFETNGARFFSDWRTERGELLFPAGFGPEKVAEAKHELGPDYSAQHQHLPMPADGGAIKAEYLQNLYEPDDAPEFSHHFISVDTAQGQSASNDKAALSVHGVFEQGIALTDGWSGRMPAPRFIELLKDFGRRYDPACFVIEQKDWGKALTQLLEDDPGFPWRIEKYTPIVSKDMRAHEASSLFYKGRYHMPRGTPLTEQATSQLVVFPASKSRDLADSIIQAAIYAQSHYTFESLPVPSYVGSKRASRSAIDLLAAHYDRRR